MSSAELCGGLSFCDVTSSTVAMFWGHIYSFMDDREKVRGMLVCKTFVSELGSEVTNITSQSFSQRCMVGASKNFRRLQSLSVDNDPAPFAWPISLAGLRFQALSYLSLRNCNISTLRLTAATTPNLATLIVSEPTDKLDECVLELPELLTVELSSITMDNPWTFASSLSTCSKLKSFTAFEFRGLKNILHVFDLPSCQTLSFNCCGDLRRLQVTAPRLTEVNLQDCTRLEDFRLVDKEGSAVTVHLVNSSLSGESILHLRDHPRVGPQLIKGLDLPEPDEADWFPPFPPFGLLPGGILGLFATILWHAFLQEEQAHEHEYDSSEDEN